VTDIEMIVLGIFLFGVFIGVSIGVHWGEHTGRNLQKYEDSHRKSVVE
jgi:hypothetical protein